MARNVRRSIIIFYIDIFILIHIFFYWKWVGKVVFCSLSNNKDIAGVKITMSDITLKILIQIIKYIGKTLTFSNKFVLKFSNNKNKAKYIV